MDIRGLRESIQEFMSGMSGINGCAVVSFGIAAHGMMIPVHPVEPGICVPCFIEMQMIHALFQFFLNFCGVIADSVIGAVCEDGISRFFRPVPDDGRFQDLLSDGFGCHFRFSDGSDDAVTVSCRQHVDRFCAGEDQALLD